MKVKYISLVIACTLLMFASCEKDGDSVCLSASVEDYSPSNAKLYLDNDGYTCWETGDVVKINGTNCTVTVDANGKSTIGGVPKNDNGYFALFPASCYNWCADILNGSSPLTIKIPHEQTYTLNSMGKQVLASPMVAYTSGDKLNFYNCASLMRVNVTCGASTYIHSITLTSSREAIAGIGIVQNRMGAYPYFAHSNAEGLKEITLTVNRQFASGTHSFFIVISPIDEGQAVGNKFTIKVATSASSSSEDYVDYTRSQANGGSNIGRSAIGTVPFTFADAEAESYSVVNNIPIKWNGTPSVVAKTLIKEIVGNMVHVNGGQLNNMIAPACASGYNVTYSAFYICKYAITQKIWKQLFSNSTPAMNTEANNGDEYAAYNLSYDLVVNYFLPAINGKVSNLTFALPTEVQWEVASRGGSGNNYSGASSADPVAWYKDNSDNHIHQVGQKNANGYGLYDMSGNVWELCSDWYSGTLAPGNYTNPTGPATGTEHVVKGGAYNAVSGNCQSFSRYHFEPGAQNGTVGARLVMSVND